MKKIIIYELNILYLLNIFKENEELISKLVNFNLFKFMIL